MVEVTSSKTESDKMVQIYVSTKAIRRGLASLMKKGEIPLSGRLSFSKVFTCIVDSDGERQPM